MNKWEQEADRILGLQVKAETPGAGTPIVAVSNSPVAATAGPASTGLADAGPFVQPFGGATPAAEITLPPAPGVDASGKLIPMPPLSPPSLAAQLEADVEAIIHKVEGK